METDTMTIRVRPVGERFAHPIYGELVVVRRTGCDGCAFRTDDCAALGNDRRAVAGKCSLRDDDIAVIFAKPNDYAIFKLTGEWP